MVSSQLGGLVVILHPPLAQLVKTTDLTLAITAAAAAAAVVVVVTVEIDASSR